MKLFFGINVTDDKNNKKYDGEVFLTREISEKQEENIQSLNKKAKDSEKVSSIPMWMSLLKSLSSTVGIVALVLIVKNALDSSLFTAVKELLPVFICGIVSAILFIFINVYSSKKQNSSESMKKADELRIAMEEVEAESLKELGVPKDAPEIDVLAASYRIEGDKVIQGSRFYTFVNLPYRAFKENGCLCLANMRHRFDIPIKYIKAMKKFEGNTVIPNWTKKEPYTDEKYEGFGISVEKTGSYKLKAYCGYIIKYNGEDYVINFAPYEVDILKQIVK